MGTRTRDTADGPVRVPISDIDLDKLVDRAKRRTSEMMRNNQQLSYGGTSERANIVGLLGEGAVQHYLRTHGVDVRDIGEDRSSVLSGEGDIEIPAPKRGTSDMGSPIRLDAKAARFSDWKGVYGRTLTTRQIDHLKVDAIVWCVVADEPIKTQSVIIMGWLPMRDIRHATRNRSRTVDGKVRLRERMHSVADLVPWTLNEGRKPPPPPLYLLPKDYFDSPSYGRRIVVGPDGPRFEEVE